MALAKVSHYEREREGFRRKYGGSLESLQKRVESMTGTEDFAIEDDLADWEFAEQALELWQNMNSSNSTWMKEQGKSSTRWYLLMLPQPEEVMGKIPAFES